MSLNGLGRSLPNLSDLRVDDPDDMASKQDVTARSEVQAGLRRSHRLARPTWKLREKMETEFWKSVDDAKTILQRIDTTPGSRHNPKIIEEVEKCAKMLTRQYEELRTVVQFVPDDIRQTADRYLQLLRQLNPQDFAEDTSSRHSGSRSSTSSKKIQLAAQAASLRAEIEARKLEEAKIIELARMEADEKARRARYEADIKKREEELRTQEIETQLRLTEIELQVLEEHDEESDKNSEIFARHRPQNDQNYDMTPKSPKKTDFVESSEMKNIMEAFNRNRLPAPEPSVFDGNPLRFAAWKSSFTSLIVSRNVPVNEKIYYLQKYLAGEARECVEGLFYFDTEEAYQNAWKQLEKRFGDKFLISEAFRNKLHIWPEIYNNDNKGLRKYADFLMQCAIAINEIPGLLILNDCHENRKLLGKLPRWSQVEWSKRVSESSTYPNFKQFAEFVVKIAERVNNPILADLYPPRSAPSKKTGEARILSTVANDVPPRSASEQNNCSFCKLENHILQNCREFRALTPVERDTHVKKNGLCYGCLTFGHLSRDCQERSKCDICSGRHPTCLHGDYNNLYPTNQRIVTNETSISMTSNTVGQTDRMSSMVVPVYLSSDNNPEREIMVYALLDSQSDNTFVLDEIMKDLVADSTLAKLKISTMTSTSTVNCRRYNGLHVRGLNSTEKIPLPASYSRSFIPTNRDQIPTPTTVKNWKHLETLSDKIPPLQQCEVGLLVGFNCSDALAPLDVILGGRAEPFAQRTALGWSVVGRTRTKEDEDLDPNFITNKIPDELSTSHDSNEVHIVCHTKVVDVTTAGVLQPLKSDIPERKGEEQAVMPQEDVRFTKTIEDSIQQDENGEKHSSRYNKSDPNGDKCENRHIKEGYVVILREDDVRGRWTLARVLETFEDADKLIRRVRFQIGTTDLDTEGSLHWESDRTRATDS